MSIKQPDPVFLLLDAFRATPLHHLSQGWRKEREGGMIPEKESRIPRIKGPDNPTSQLLPIMSIKGCSRDGEGKGKEAVKDREVKTVVCDKVECERWCVTKQEGMWKDSMHVCMYVCMYVCMCDKVVCERWHKKPLDVRLCHACHAKRKWMWDCATPATWNQSGCEIVPRLPRKVPRRHGRPKPAQARHPVP